MHDKDGKKLIENYPLEINNNELDDKKRQYGQNKVEEKKYNYFLGLLKNTFSPFNVILFAIVAFTIFQMATSDDDLLSDIITTSVIGIMITISVLIGYIQEIKTLKYSKTGNDYNDLSVFVIRDVDIETINNDNYLELLNKKVKVNRTEIYPGDLVYLRSSDIVPADVKILFSNTLTVDQSNVTGESYPVDKSEESNEKPTIERTDLCFQNTVISSGYMIGLVVGTGKNVIFGKLNSKRNAKSKDSFNRSLFRISMLLIGYILVFCPIILAIDGLKTQDWVNAITFSVAIAVGITPEMLPIIVSSNLVNGIKKISKDKMVIKNLSTLQNFGAIDVLCLDKTGTLTNGNIELNKLHVYHNMDREPVQKLLYFASLYQTGFGNAIDKAIKEKYKNDFHNESIKKTNELPFDFKRKRVSLIFDDDNELNLMFTKGAPDKILEICTKKYDGEKIVDLTKEDIAKINSDLEKIGDKGFRSIAFCEKRIKDEKISMYDESDMVYVGFATFSDNLKEQAREMIKILNKRKVSYKILTGDNEIITKHICLENGIRIKGIIDGETLGKMTDDEIKEAVMRNNIFVKLDPNQKRQIIWALKENDLIVGFAGDGANDVLSFKEANLAISFDDVDPNIKSHADAIIINDNLNVIDDAILRGRVAFANILKYMKITVSSNIGNMISMLVATAWLAFQPMLGVQILIQNLIYDISQFALVNDNVDGSFLSSPQRLSIRRVFIFSVINAPVSSIFDISTFLIMYYGFGITNNSSIEQTYKFNGAWFIVGLVTQTLVMFVYRTERINLFKLKIKWFQYVAISIVTMLAFVLVYTPMGDPLKFGGLTPIYIPIAIAIIISYLILALLVKYIYIKIFKSWL